MSSHTPLQISNVKHGPAVDSLLHDTPDFIVNWTYVTTIMWQQVWSNKVRCHVFCKSLSTLSQKSATVAEFRRCLADFSDSRTFLRQCGQGLSFSHTCGYLTSSICVGFLMAHSHNHKKYSFYG